MLRDKINEDGHFHRSTTSSLERLDVASRVAEALRYKARKKDEKRIKERRGQLDVKLDRAREQERQWTIVVFTYNPPHLFSLFCWARIL
jgi:hypothetical protein